ncbi:MAG: NAD-dependent epimerase/dehydratase family protein [Marinobacter sp.]|uniref:NAD-dependent epimerase/dehydratase family protein n=1 Tax=Marinobacter sp. TaxID=50741 RepID=UPI00299DF787|nr:NAD-dependent epimerase/dehydratase family protein [Marinobacter sp.]MDX1635400.1 NAD-dependent epimerase/dehydratase family protein [Marinobacter sp.]
MAITVDTNQRRILVAGCGALGGRIAERLSRHHQVFGLRRNAAAVPASVTAIGADLLDPATLQERVPAQLDAVVYCLTPGQYDEAGYRDAYVTGLDNLIRAVQRHSTPARLVFISSTSVYHQDDDSWVDEDSPTRPEKFSGQHILAGEQRALESDIAATVVRLSGIYGPTRKRFLHSVVNGELAPEQPSPYTNRIHEEDASRAVTHLLEKALAGEKIAERYLVSDCEPARLDEVVEWVRAQLPCAEPKADARTGGRAGSKRCDNSRLRATGFEFLYPDYRAGYREMID